MTLGIASSSAGRVHHSVMETDFEAWLHEAIFPMSAVVIATENARAVVKQATNLSVSEVLRPFGGYFMPFTAQYKVVDRPMKATGLHVRFYDSVSEAAPCDFVQAERKAVEACHSCAPTPVKQLSGSDQCLPVPWFERWVEGWCRGSRWEPHEALDQPICLILVVSSADTDVTSAFEQLMHQSNLPEMCRQNLLDGSVQKIKLIVHDDSRTDDVQSNPESLLERIKAGFNPETCFLLRLDTSSSSVDAAAVVDSPSSQELTDLRLLYRDRLPPSRLLEVDNDRFCVGMRWSAVETLCRLGECAVLKCGVAYLERKLASLDNAIGKVRRGFKNKFQHFLRNPTSGQASYSLHSVEWQLRLAGDIAFHLRAYDKALEFYRGVASDFKQDQQFAHAGGVYEMAGICGFFLGHSEWDRWMEQASDSYHAAYVNLRNRDNVANDFQRQCVRTAVLRAVMLGHAGPMKNSPSGASVLIRANTDVPDDGVRAALLLEYAAYLHGKAGQVRKKGFNLVLAGHAYGRTQNFRLWALRCYSAAAPQYTGLGWMHIMDHLMYTIAKQSFTLGDPQAAMDHFIGLFNEVGKRQSTGVGVLLVPPNKQQNYIKAMAHIVKEWPSRMGGAPLAPVDMHIPLLRFLRLGVAQASSGQGPIPREISFTRSPKISAQPSSPTLKVRSSMRHPPRKLADQLKLGPITQVVHVGETVFMECLLTNPLSISVVIEKIQLVFDKPDDTDCTVVASAAVEGGGGTTVLRLPFSATAKGELAVVGVRWVLGPQNDPDARIGVCIPVLNPGSMWPKILVKERVISEEQDPPVLELHAAAAVSAKTPSH